jgi:hypothetical protein
MTAPAETGVGSQRRDRALGWLAVLAGLALAVGVQARAPVGVPLYDGVLVAEPYRYLHPTGDEVGDPSSASKPVPIPGGQSPVFAAITEESPPQAQLVAQQDAFEIPPGTSEIAATITPVDSTVQPADGHIAGNVYRFAVTGANDAPLVPKPCDICRTLVLRAPETVTDGTIVHLENGGWVDVPTQHAGQAAMFQVNAPAMGDYAVVPRAGARGVNEGAGIDPLLFGGIALGIFFAVVAGLFWYRRRPPPLPVAQLGPCRERTPSKRRGPRRPPGGRSGS